MRTTQALALLRRSLAASALLVVAGCGSAVTLSPPDDFVVLDEDYGPFDERATNAHGVVIAARAVDNDPQGGVAFWVDAVKNRLRTMGGYALLEEQDVTAAGGQQGKQLRFGRDDRGHTYHYWVTLFVTDARIYVVEAGGRDDRFEEAREAVEQAILRTELH